MCLSACGHGCVARRRVGLRGCQHGSNPSPGFGLLCQRDGLFRCRRQEPRGSEGEADECARHAWAHSLSRYPAFAAAPGAQGGPSPVSPCPMGLPASRMPGVAEGQPARSMCQWCPVQGRATCQMGTGGSLPCTQAFEELGQEQTASRRSSLVSQQGVRALGPLPLVLPSHRGGLARLPRACELPRGLLQLSRPETGLHVAWVSVAGCEMH